MDQVSTSDGFVGTPLAHIFYRLFKIGTFVGFVSYPLIHFFAYLLIKVNFLRARGVPTKPSEVLLTE